MQAGPAPGWVAALFPTDGADEREQRLAVLLEAEFAGGPMLSAQFLSRILTLASPTAEESERRELTAAILANLDRYCSPKPEPSATLLAVSAVKAMHWTFGGQFPHDINRDGFVPMQTQSVAQQESARDFHTACVQGRMNETPSSSTALDQAFMFDPMSRVWAVLHKAALAAGTTAFGGLIYSTPEEATPVGQILVATLVHLKIRLEVNGNDTVHSIKTKIEGLEGIPVTQQRLIYEDPAGEHTQLEDHRTLVEYDIQPIQQLPESDEDFPATATVRLVLRLRGGCCSFDFQRQVAPAPNTRVPPSTPVRMRLSLAKLSGDPSMAWGGERCVTRGWFEAFHRSYEVAVVQVRKTVRACVLYPTPRVLRWGVDELRGFFHVMSRRAPELLTHEDLRWQLLESLALPVEEWEAEVLGSRRVAVRTREPGHFDASGVDQGSVSGAFPDDVCFTVTPPVDGWSPAARYRVEMYVRNESDSDYHKLCYADRDYSTVSPGNGHSSHSYSFDVSDSDSDVPPAVEIPMRTSGGLLRYSY
jgi:hypothetical protein